MVLVLEFGERGSGAIIDYQIGIVDYYIALQNMLS
jgi:hypothetical protein